MDPFQEASLSIIKEMSLQLILIAVGAFSVAASILATRERPTTSKWALYASLCLLIISTLCGVVALGSAVAQLTDKKFDPWQMTIRWAYLLQLTTVWLGGVSFTFYLTRNIP